MSLASRRDAATHAAPTRYLSIARDPHLEILAEFGRKQLAFDRALQAYNASPEWGGKESERLRAAFAALQELRPRLASVVLNDA